MMNRRELLARLGLAAAALAWTGRTTAAVRPAFVLSEDQRKTLGIVAELIIPATDTPGADGAGVVGFMEMMLGQWFTAGERADFLAGIASLDATSRELCGATFRGAGPEQQIRVLTVMESRSLQADGSLDPKSPIARMKLLVLTGYYTSEVGASVELDDTMIFSSYEGCIPMGPDDRAQSMTTPAPTAL